MEKRIIVIANLDRETKKQLASRINERLNKVTKNGGFDVIVENPGEKVKPLIEKIPEIINNVYRKYPIKEMLDPNYIMLSVSKGKQYLVLSSLDGEIVGTSSLIPGELKGSPLYEMGRTAVLEKTQGLEFGKALVVARRKLAKFLQQLEGVPGFLFSEPRAVNTRTVHNVAKYGELVPLGISPLYNVNAKKESVVQMYLPLGDKKAVLPLIEEPLNKALRKVAKNFEFQEYNGEWNNGEHEVYLIGGEVLAGKKIGTWFSHEGASLIKINVECNSLRTLEKILEKGEEIALNEKLATVAIAIFTDRRYDQLLELMKKHGYILASYIPTYNGKPGVLFSKLTEHSPELAELYLPDTVPREIGEQLHKIHWSHQG